MNATIKLLATALLIPAMIHLSTPAYAQEAPPPDANALPTPQAGGGIILGALVIVLGIVVYVGLRKLCRRLNQPATPPPTPPTNQPPMVSFTGEPLYGYSGGLVMPMGNLAATNSDPQLDYTNDCGIAAWDISQYGWVDQDGQLYEVLQHTKIESSTNLRDWRVEYELHVYSSVSNVIMCWRDRFGVPVFTNGSRIGPAGTFTNTAPLNLMDRDSKFFRLATP